MLSVIIRTRNGEDVLLEGLRPLVGAAAEGIVRDVVFLDVGSTDGTAQIADAAGAAFLSAARQPGEALPQALARAHRGDWVMLLDQATVLSPGWLDETLAFVERQARTTSGRGRLSAVYRPEHEPELGSADIRRRLAMLVANRMFSTARLSQGILVRRRDMAAEGAPVIDWAAHDPAVRLTSLLRLRSRTHMAMPMTPLRRAVAAESAKGALSRAAL